jgi:hypothetical protein
MITEFIIPYREGNTSLPRVIGGLEGSLSVLEENLSKEFYARFDKHLFDLDIILALGEEEEQTNQVNRLLNELETVIRRELVG